MRALMTSTLVVLLAACGAPDEDVPADGWPTVPDAPGPIVLASGLDSPCGLALVGSELYVADEGSDRIVRVPVAGGEVTEVAVLHGPSYLAAAGDDLVVSQRAAGSVSRVRGGEVTELAGGQVSPGRVRTDGDDVFFIVEGAGSDGAIRRVSIEGGGLTDVASALATPRSLTVAGGRCYFTELGTGHIGFVSAHGGELPTRKTDTRGTPYAVAVDTAASQVYWVEPGTRNGGWVRRGNLDLGTPISVGFTAPGPRDLVLTGEKVVYATSYTVSASPRGSGAYQDLAVATDACDLLVDGETVFWTDRARGQVLAVALE
ncbi:MAG: hypothetical protein HYS27_08925 [Deltaproteobacteria bacterium]|nr:hypothetical protein [Deltaproteobacteria bacterium]